MTMPTNVGVIDLMVGMPPGPDHRGGVDSLRPFLRDRESLELLDFPAQHLFKDLPPEASADDPISAVLTEMDRFGVERGLIDVSDRNSVAQRALREHPDRFIASFSVDPRGGMETVRELRRMVDRFDVKAATGMPAGCQVPINDKQWYPVYAACVDLDIPICLCTGIPGPRVPGACQDVLLVDEVCWFFPDLRFVMRHGAEPWAEMAVKLMLKWPNLYYSTSAFAPRYYPREIIDFANSRGADKILYAGYFPHGLSLERIFKELTDLPLRDEVWPKFLRENALRIFKLDGTGAST